MKKDNRRKTERKNERKREAFLKKIMSFSITGIRIS